MITLTHDQLVALIDERIEARMRSLTEALRQRALAALPEDPSLAGEATSARLPSPSAAEPAAGTNILGD